MYVRPPPKTSHGGARPEDPAVCAEGPCDAKPVRLTVGAFPNGEPALARPCPTHAPPEPRHTAQGSQDAQRFSRSMHLSAEESSTRALR